MKINKNTQINIRLTNAEMQILKLKAKKRIYHYQNL
jgi:predicted DNA binding CopG/RHH family protein